MVRAMADALKDQFNRDTVRRIGAELQAAHPAFDVTAFVRRAGGFEHLGLTDRGRHVSVAMRASLPAEVPAALDVIVRSFGPPLERTEDNGFTVFRYLPHAYFIAEHGLDHLDASVAAMHALTQRFTAEFTVRPFLERHTDAMLRVLARWATDPSPHVRRLVSEGTRPRLPWASRLTVFDRDPAPILALLTALRDDPSEYVRRSVANHLNDLTRADPARVLALAESWREGAPEARVKLLRHALRSLVKAGDARALAVLGAQRGAKVRVTGTLSPKRAVIGESLRVTVTVTSEEAAPADFVVDAAVHFVRADGSERPKVFKLRAVRLDPGASATFARTVSLRQHSTRTHHPGRHRVEALVNGSPTALGAVDVRAPK
jgi:3-methyladenine DNA glycosylase AlkC